MRNFLLATTELLLWLVFVFILFPSLHFVLVLFSPPSPVWSGCRGQRSRVYRNYLSWNRFVKLLIMHTSLFHMFSRKTVLTFYCECFWSLLNEIRAFILVKNRKMFWFLQQKKKEDICWRAFFCVCKILQLFSSFSYFWVWSLAGQFWNLYGRSLLPRK